MNCQLNKKGVELIWVIIYGMGTEQINSFGEIDFLVVFRWTCVCLGFWLKHWEKSLWLLDEGGPTWSGESGGLGGQVLMGPDFCCSHLLEVF